MTSRTQRSDGHRVRRGIGRSSVASLPLVMVTLLIVLLLPSAQPLETTGPKPTARLTSGGGPLYQAPELWGGGDPDEPCTTCSVQSLLGESQDQSVQPDAPVNPVIGDYTTTDPLFSVPAAGADMDMDLTYDSEEATSEQAAGDNGGPLGWGWSSEMLSSITINGNQVVVNNANGSETDFSGLLDGDGCVFNLGNLYGFSDYLDYQRYTLTGSQTDYCASSRVDAALGSDGYGLWYFEGDGATETYGWNGQPIYMGSQEDNDAVTFNRPGPGSGICPNFGAGVCLTETDAGGRSVILEVDDFGLAVAVIDPDGNEWTFGYDSNQDLASITGPLTSTVQRYYYYVDYPSPYDHEMQGSESPDGYVTTIDYYSYGMVSGVESPVGGETSYSYTVTDCVTDSLACLEGPQSTLVQYADGENDNDAYYDGVLEGESFGSSTTYAGAGNQNWSFDWEWANPDTNQPQYVDVPLILVLPDGLTATIVYDAAWNVVSYTDPYGNTTNWMYNDTASNYLQELCWMAEPGVSVPSNASCSNPPTGSTSYTYDSYGHVLSETDPLGNTTRSGYYTDGELCWVAQPTVTGGSSCGADNGGAPTQAPAGATAYTYWNGNVASKTVAYNTTAMQDTQTVYDADSQPLWEIPPDGYGHGSPGDNVYETYTTYYTYGEPNQVTAPLDRVTTYTYDADGNVLTVSDPPLGGGLPGPVTTNTYDEDGRLCWTIQAMAVTAGSCNPTGPCSDGAAPTGSTCETYWANTTAIATETDPNGHTTTYTYGDPQHPTDPTVIADPMGTAVTYETYNTLGQVCEKGSSAQPCGAVATGDASWNYNDDGELTSATDQDGETYNYGYNARGDLTSTENPLGIYTADAYDNDDRPIQQVNAFLQTGQTTVSQNYDADGRGPLYGTVCDIGRLLYPSDRSGRDGQHTVECCQRTRQLGRQQRHQRASDVYVFL